MALGPHAVAHGSPDPALGGIHVRGHWMWAKIREDVIGQDLIVPTIVKGCCETLGGDGICTLE